MLFGDLAPLLRPLSRRLATAGWCFTAAGLAAGLAVALGTGVSLPPGMQLVQAAGIVATAASALLIGLGAVCQPTAGAEEAAADAPEPWAYPAAASQVRSFLLGAIVLLLGLLGFATAGLFLPSGPSPQSLAFTQIFLQGSVSCGLTFVLLNKVLPQADREAPLP
ncbi:hypothetical protein [Arthrobacter cavernae]|uniref:Uncharacterized protein n=1 Tax=Arthrobacter cavernae TaxID=2817681 RepID=A0A939KI00_9MICC|nr:hypothetical protein [Arthrobacter cavernae]MBO1267132.1 hypothetical protein [Arthrobacter cavernae]